MADILHDLGMEPGALVVNAVSFLLLLWLMKRLLFGPIGAFIEQRKQGIANDLDQAATARSEAQGELADIRGRREATLEAVAEEGEAARQEALQEAEELKKAARDRARETGRAARAATEQQEREVAAELRDEAAETAASMCRRLLQETLDEERHRALLDEFIADIERMAAAERAPT